jgi:hypothetical protein
MGLGERGGRGGGGVGKAEVTVVGIAIQGLFSRTMEARMVPGLYAIGEAVHPVGLPRLSARRLATVSREGAKPRGTT